MSTPDDTFLIERLCPRCNTLGVVQPDGTPFPKPNPDQPFVIPTPNIQCPACKGKIVFSLRMRYADLHSIHYANGDEAFSMEEAIDEEFLRQLRANGFQWD